MGGLQCAASSGCGRVRIREEPLQLAKLMSCETGPFGLMVSVGSWPAEAVTGTMPLKMSRMLMVWTSYPVR